MLRKSNDRGHFKNSWLDSYHTFSFGTYYDPEFVQFGSLRVINQDIIAANSGFDLHSHKDMEIFTYVLDGALEHQDSTGHRKQIRRGDVQIMSAGKGIMHSEYNPSATESAEILQIWLLPEVYGLEPRYDQKHFSREQKKNKFKLIISPHAEDETLMIYQEAWVWASVFEKGFKDTFSLDQGVRAWLHVGNGEIEVNEKFLQKGDGMSISPKEQIHIKGIADSSEFLIIELGE